MLSSLSVILPCSGNCQIKWQRRTLRIPQFSNLFNDSFRMLALCTILYLLRFLTMLSARIIRKQATEMGTIHSYLAASLVQVGSGQESFDVCQRSPRSTVHFGNLLCLQLHTAGSHILRTWKVLVRARAHTHTHTHTLVYIYICNLVQHYPISLLPEMGIFHLLCILWGKFSYTNNLWRIFSINGHVTIQQSCV